MSILFIMRFYILYELNISFHNSEPRADVYQPLALNFMMHNIFNGIIINILAVCAQRANQSLIIGRREYPVFHAFPLKDQITASAYSVFKFVFCLKVSFQV